MGWGLGRIYPWSFSLYVGLWRGVFKAPCFWLLFFVRQVHFCMGCISCFKGLVIFKCATRKIGLIIFKLLLVEFFAVAGVALSASLREQLLASGHVFCAGFLVVVWAFDWCRKKQSPTIGACALV